MQRRMPCRSLQSAWPDSESIRGAPPLQRGDLIDFREKKAEPVDFSIGSILYEDRSGRRKSPAIFTQRPDPDDLECNAGPSPRQFRGVDQPPSFVVPRRSIRLTLDDVVQPNLGSRNPVHPFADILAPTKHDRSDLIFIVWRYLREHIRSVQFHHAVDKLLNALFLSIHG